MTLFERILIHQVFLPEITSDLHALAMMEYVHNSVIVRTESNTNTLGYCQRVVG